MPKKEERLMKAMKWIIPGLLAVLGILGLCFFLDAQRVPPQLPLQSRKKKRKKRPRRMKAKGRTHPHQNLLCPWPGSGFRK